MREGRLSDQEKGRNVNLTFHRGILVGETAVLKFSMHFNAAAIIDNHTTKREMN